MPDLTKAPSWRELNAARAALVAARGLSEAAKNAAKEEVGRCFRKCMGELNHR